MNLNLESVTTALGQVSLTLLVIGAIVVALEGFLYLLLVKLVKTKHAMPIMLVAPAALGLLVLIGYPLLWELNVSFTNMSLRNFKNPGFLGLEQGMFVGFENYIQVFTEPVLKLTGFWQLFAQTIIWTFVNVFFHVVAGHGPRAHAPPQDAGQGHLPRPASSCPGRSRRSSPSSSGGPSTTSSTAQSTSSSA